MRIGIDLGTTFSAAAWVDANGTAAIISNDEGQRLTPSVVMEDGGIVVVGEKAKESSVLMSDQVISAAKDYMGTRHLFSMPSGNEYTPEDVSALVLKKIKQDSEKFLGEKVDEAVITVPAYFTDAQRKATEDAGRIAGLNVLGMINEPTAAAIYYAYAHKIIDANILVYDLGGGTFDASIVSVSKDKVEVKATGGIRKLGGHFFDQMILDYVTDYLLDEYEIDLYDDEYIDELQDLMLKSEKCKIALSTKESEQIIIKVGKVKERLTITRKQFEEMIHTFYLRTESTVKMVLSDANMTWNDIQKILLVGGSSKIPMIVENLQKLSGLIPSHEVNPDETVALGAAVFANSGIKEIVDVTSHSLGVVTIDEKTRQKKNDIIIVRDSILPAIGSKEFETFDRTGKVLVEITEGEDEDIEYVNILDTLEIKLPQNTPKHTLVKIEMNLDKNQLLHVFVRIATTPEVYKELHIERKSNLSDEDVALKSALVSKVKVC